jgi:nucleotide-binding universal stress UspA family protein
MEIDKILYATDTSDLKFSQVQCLVDLRSLGLQEVVFLHTTEVEGWKTMFTGFGINSKTLIIERPLVPAILNAAHGVGASLIAASLNRDARWRLRGSMTRQLIRTSDMPVLILPEHAQESGSEQNSLFTHVIFAVDWSVASEKAQSYLLKLKTVINELEIVHVIHRKLSVRDMGNLKERLSQTRKIFLDQGIDAEAHVYAGKPAEEIMLAAKDYDATCIVMGTTGKPPLKELLSKSYSYGVAEASVLPTLFVP